MRLRELQSQVELQRYLALATWGLWGAKRREVRAELEEHLLERVDGLIVFGVPPCEAVSRAIRELGPPERVCAGMNQVYLMPKIIKLSALSALLVSLGTLGMTSGSAQVAVTNKSPNPPVCAKARNGMQSNDFIEVISSKGGVYCYRFRQPQQSQYYLSLNSLERTLKPLGVRVQRQGNETVLTFPGARQPNRLRTTFSRDGDRFANLRELPFNFMATGLPVTVTGWMNPTIQVGQTTFTLGDTQLNAPASIIYESVLMDIGSELKITHKAASFTNRAANTDLGPQFYTHTVRMNAPAGSIIGIFSRDERGLALIDQAPLGQDGQVDLYSMRDRLQFVSDPKELTPYLSGGRGQALLVRLTGLIASDDTTQKGKYEIVLPSQTTSDGTK
ncbi:hypothetical protein Deipe_2576 [Deinococcus peraridilitoris DSM 19664]|uniref:Uncharacterized protein n=1 Tax=Deinococcus peraridilitoris (strain DSM 19664 / LMG 22246 / CIP 109416 / KR-200) TaxID=937777 RepID=L0A2G5_DEIPD|nr:hypothetical protein Deipe_2576 [Deinococcus peraridilitoris DSM 19664]